MIKVPKGVSMSRNIRGGSDNSRNFGVTLTGVIRGHDLGLDEKPSLAFMVFGVCVVNFAMEQVKKGELKKIKIE